MTGAEAVAAEVPAGPAQEDREKTQYLPGRGKPREMGGTRAGDPPFLLILLTLITATRLSTLPPVSVVVVSQVPPCPALHIFPVGRLPLGSLPAPPASLLFCRPACCLACSASACAWPMLQSEPIKVAAPYLAAKPLIPSLLLSLLLCPSRKTTGAGKAPLETYPASIYINLALQPRFQSCRPCSPTLSSAAAAARRPPSGHQPWPLPPHRHVRRHGGGW